MRHSSKNISNINKLNQGGSPSFPYRTEHSWHALNISVLSLSAGPLEGSRQGLLVADANHFVALNSILYLTQEVRGGGGFSWWQNRTLNLRKWSYQGLELY